ncbi:MAG: hypothetical protein AB8F94_06150 [Saprospiraceae bacterium]
MKQDWLDNNLDDKLGDYDSPMDLENAWELLQAKRQPPKKKKNFLFFWMLFGFLTIGVTGSYFLLNNETDNNYNNVITETEVSSKTESQPLEETVSTSPILPDSRNTNQNNIDDNIITETKTIQNASKNKSYENQNYSNSKETKSGIEKNTPFSKTKNNNVITSDENLGFPKKSTIGLISPKENETDKAVKNTIQIDSAISQKEVQPIAVLFLPSLETSLLKFSQEENYEILDVSYYSIPTVYPPSTSTPNYFGIVAGYGIQTKGQVLPEESSLDAVTVNAFYEYRFGRSKWFFKTGINYDQFVKKLETTTEQSFSEEVDNQLITVNHFQDGSTQDVFGVADVAKIEKTSSKNFNRYRLISIPMTVGYDLISLNRASLQIEGGMARSILGFHSGKDFDMIESDFKKQGVWQGLYGLNLNVKTGARTNIFTSLKGNYHFNKIGQSEQLDQLDLEKFRIHQIQVGLRFKL